MKEAIKVVLIILLIVVTIIGTVFAHILGEQEYNNGICKNCGGRYHLKAVNRMHFEYYECEACGNVIQK